MTAFHSGFVALIGRPNVGKSTLLNRLVGTKVSIVSPKPQTTRHRILGIHTDDTAQIVYIDTPGMQEHAPKTMNRIMNRVARASVYDVDCVVLVITAEGWGRGDRVALKAACEARARLILAINKVDTLTQREALLPLLEESMHEAAFEEMVPLSAKTGLQVDRLEQAIRARLPEHSAYFEADVATDRSESFVAAELLREQLFHSLGAEVPYSSAVEIERFTREPGGLRIDAVIWIEKEGQKGIVIGKDGQRLKEIGRHARLEMQSFFGSKVFLGLWVKVREGWSDDSRALARLGYAEDGP